MSHTQEGRISSRCSQLAPAGLSENRRTRQLSPAIHQRVRDLPCFVWMNYNSEYKAQSALMQWGRCKTEAALMSEKERKLPRWVVCSDCRPPNLLFEDNNLSMAQNIRKIKRHSDIEKVAVKSLNIICNMFVKTQSLVHLKDFAFKCFKSVEIIYEQCTLLVLQSFSN